MFTLSVAGHVGPSVHGMARRKRCDEPLRVVGPVSGAGGSGAGMLDVGVMRARQRKAWAGNGPTFRKRPTAPSVHGVRSANRGACR